VKEIRMLIFALAAMGLQAGSPAVEPVEAREEIVIRGTRMRDALADCLARQCPPGEEVDAAMAAAAESFREGKYLESKATLTRAVARNAQHAAKIPGKMSDLYATLADVAEHEGDNELSRASALRSVTVLRKHVGADHPATLAAAARIGDMRLKLGNTQLAATSYRAAAEAAERAGDDKVAAALGLRRARLAFLDGSPRTALRYLDAVERRYPHDAWLSRQGRILRAQILFRAGDEAGAQRLMAGITTADQPPPLLAAPPPPSFQSPAEDASRRHGEPSITITSAIEASGAIRWVDIGFWIKPDGRTEEVEIVQPGTGTGWAEPLIAYVAGRRYAATDPSGPGFYRVERYTLRPSYGLDKMSRLKVRNGEPTLHIVDMTSSVVPPKS
jgi:tetratricopeptide (TPR) repeat protein